MVIPKPQGVVIGARLLTTFELLSKVLTFIGLDGSTSAQEREKLINKFNTSSDVWLFLLSTKLVLILPHSFYDYLHCLPYTELVALAST